VVADRARRAPHRELAKRPELGHSGVEFFSRGGLEDDLRAHAQVLKPVLADREAEPAVSVVLASFASRSATVASA
jgi:hypothetical protein